MKFFQFIQKANQVILFVAGIGVILGVTLSFYSFFFGFESESEYRQEVEVIAKDDDGAKRNTVLTKSFRTCIKDVYIFEIRSSTINLSQKYGVPRYSEPGCICDPGSSSEPEVVNMLFVSEDGSSRLLFERNCFVTETRLAVFEQAERWGYHLYVNLYRVVREDKNGDGVLSPEDGVDLYVSEYDGTDSALLVRDVADFSVIKDNVLLITAGEKETCRFFLYDGATKKLTELDTEVEVRHAGTAGSQ